MLELRLASTSHTKEKQPMPLTVRVWHAWFALALAAGANPTTFLAPFPFFLIGCPRSWRGRLPAREHHKLLQTSTSLLSIKHAAFPQQAAAPPHAGSKLCSPIPPETSREAKAAQGSSHAQQGVGTLWTREHKNSSRKKWLPAWTRSQEKKAHKSPLNIPKATTGLSVLA